MRVDVERVTRLVSGRLLELGVPAAHAALVAESLVDADRRGLSSHGTARLQVYLDAILGGAIDPEAVPTPTRSAPATSLWNGNRSFGQVAAETLMGHSIQRAQDVGAHVAVCHSTNHFGAAGYWAKRASDAGCLGMAFTTAHPVVVPTRGARPELGTNPISLAIRGVTEEFVLDMATSTVPLGMVEVRLREGRDLPAGWAVDAHGNPVHDPSEVYPDVLLGQVGGLVPLGGDGELTGGHKGYGMASFVEILCAVLGGGGDLTPGRPLEQRSAGLSSVSHCYITIDPDHLAGRKATEEALDSMVVALRDTPPADPDQPVIVHGDKERWRAEEQQSMVEIEDLVWDALVT